MTVSGILGCTALLVVGMAIKNSVTDLMPKQYEHISRYDLMAVTIADDFDNFTNQISSDDQIQDYLSLQTDSIQVVNDSSEELFRSISFRMMPRLRTIFVWKP